MRPTDKSSGSYQAAKENKAGTQKDIDDLTGWYPKESTAIDTSGLPKEGNGGSLEKVVKTEKTSDGLPESLSTTTYHTGSEDKAPSFDYLRPSGKDIDKGGFI